MDAQVGRVLQELDRLGLSKNTAVVLWGDHGWKLGEHASWCKHTNFEIDARAPMIARIPGLKEGLRTRALVEFVDMYPALCDACELDKPEHLEGASFAPLMEDPVQDWKQAAFSQYPRGKVMGYAMRTDRFRYVEWQNRESGEVLARELYDHEKDPQENVNAVDRADYQGEIDGLSRMLKAGWQAAM